MNNKKLAGLTVALAVVVGIIVVSNKIADRKPAEKTLLFFPALPERPVASFLVADKGDSVRLARKGDVWQVMANVSPAQQGLTLGTNAAAASADYPADSAAVQTVLDKFKAMRKDDLISQKVEKQTTFEVDSAKGLFVQAWDDKGKDLGGFYIGKNGPDYSSNYVRLAGSNDVYLVGGSIRYSFFADRSRWKDKNIVKFDKSLAEKIVLVKQGGGITLEKGSDSTGGWNITAPEQARAKKDGVDDMLGALSAFVCGDWETSDSVLSKVDMGFNPPQLTATVVLKGGMQKQVNVGKKKEGTSRFWVNTPAIPGTVFLVDDYTLTRIDKNMQTLRDSVATASEPGTATTPPSTALSKIQLKK